MTATMPAAGDPQAPGADAPISRGRRTLVWILIVAAALIGVASILTTWVHRQMLDQQSWREASAELIENPQIRHEIATYAVDELYDNVNVQQVLDDRLPADLKPLAAPVAGALRQPATDAVERALDAPRFQQTWINASVLAHQKLVNVLENKTGDGISTGDGVVTLELGTLIRDLGADLGLAPSTLDRIPPDAGTVTVMHSNQLATAQTAVAALRVLSTALLVLVLALLALAVFLARGRRRETLRTIGWAFVLVGVVVLIARRTTGAYALDALTSSASRGSGETVWLIGSSILAQIGWAAILYGGLIIAGAVLAGPTAQATAIRRWIAPVLNGRPALAAAAVGGAYLLLVLWGPTHALTVLWGIALLGVLLAAGVAALRRHTLREFPSGP
jgi:hypothetical protein